MTLYLDPTVHIFQQAKLTTSENVHYSSWIVSSNSSSADEFATNDCGDAVDDSFAAKTSSSSFPEPLKAPCDQNPVLGEEACTVSTAANTTSTHSRTLRWADECAVPLKSDNKLKQKSDVNTPHIIDNMNNDKINIENYSKFSETDQFNTITADSNDVNNGKIQGILKPMNPDSSSKVRSDWLNEMLSLPPLSINRSPSVTLMNRGNVPSSFATPSSANSSAHRFPFEANMSLPCVTPLHATVHTFAQTPSSPCTSPEPTHDPLRVQLPSTTALSPLLLDFSPNAPCMRSPDDSRSILEETLSNMSPGSSIASSAPGSTDGLHAASSSSLPPFPNLCIGVSDSVHVVSELPIDGTTPARSAAMVGGSPVAGLTDSPHDIAALAHTRSSPYRAGLLSSVAAIRSAMENRLGHRSTSPASSPSPNVRKRTTDISTETQHSD